MISFIMLRNSTIYNRYGECFFRQGRPDFYMKQCVTFCVVVFQHNICKDQFCNEFVKRSIPLQFYTMKSLHAEDMALREIQLTERNENW